MEPIRLLTAIIFIASGLALTSAAQGCEKYGVTLNVHDNELNPVPGATFRVVPWLKDELKGKTFVPVAEKPGASRLELAGDHSVTGNYKVFITAPGFLENEKAITFPNCAQLSHEVLLLKKKEKRAVLEGKIGDDKGRSVAYAQITFVGDGQPERTINADYMGYYEIKLKPGDYKMRIRKNSYETFVNNNMKIPKDGKLEFHVRMRSLQ